MNTQETESQEWRIWGDDATEDALWSIMLNGSADNETGSVDETGAHYFLIRGPFGSGGYWHVYGTPVGEYSWTSEPLASLDNDTGTERGARALALLLASAGWIAEPQIQYVELEPEYAHLALEPGAAGYICVTDSMGWRDWTSYETETELDVEWARIESEVQELYGPQEDDATITPSGNLGALTAATYAGKFLGEYPDDDAALKALAEIITEENFSPDVWSISDHGNAHLISESFYRDYMNEGKATG